MLILFSFLEADVTLNKFFGKGKVNPFFLIVHWLIIMISFNTAWIYKSDVLSEEDTRNQCTMHFLKFVK